MEKNVFVESSKKYEDRIAEIKSVIEKNEIRQTEIRAHIFSIEQNIKMFTDLLDNVKTNDQKVKHLVAIQKNIELVSKLYDNISGFESISQRYHQDISKLTTDKLKFIHMDLRRVEAQFDANSSEVSELAKEIRSALQTISQDKDTQKKINSEIVSPEYSMD